MARSNLIYINLIHLIPEKLKTDTLYTQEKINSTNFKFTYLDADLFNDEKINVVLFYKHEIWLQAS